ncbi:hypothetical protein [Lysobacter antibioticus]|uniref:hypothetical protein n=1 Tax=Lysobacter antibioticus TaxID=84531 RepID=UPI0007E8EC91|nr:hypothetical protein [Lysobacter antibioticus]
MRTISATVETYVEAEVDVDVDTLVSNLTPEQAQVVADRARSQCGDPEASRYIERAFLALKGLSNPPRELVDLFWHVYGRAIA